MIPGLNAQTVSPFPNPPDYALQYTSERISHGSILDPPAPQTEFRVFGEDYKLDAEVIPPLSSSGIRELYTNKNDWKTEMKKLNRSVIAAFLDLIEILIRCPDHPSRDEKMNDIHTIFINMHHLINEYRPVQGRDTIRLLQQQQLEQLEETVKRFRDYMQQGRSVLCAQFESIDTNLPPPPKPNPITRVELLETNGEVQFLDEIKKEEDGEKMDCGNSIIEKESDETIQRQQARPNTKHLKLRQICDLANLKLD
ncbi:unnamed protein product [Caenorhabditis angaria]|uniref:Mediator of RNA polymerase II transcription subunit 7 n=1 Tax=Caenorhabditis angaria TaxID=860376 RepID=A0A9P1I3X1_9PELO|nr:unnamed protein product [Caenorhabditis angaria]